MSPRRREPLSVVWIACVVLLLAGNAGLAAEKILYSWDFEETDPVEFWTGSNDYTINFKGLTDELRHGGKRSFKLDITYNQGAAYSYFRVPLPETINLREHHVLLRARIRVVERGTNLVGLGHYTPGGHCRAFEYYDVSDDWREATYHLDDLLLRHDRDAYLTLAGWYFSLADLRPGRIVVYVDDVEFVECEPDGELAAKLTQDNQVRRDLMAGLQGVAEQVEKAFAAQRDIEGQGAAARAYAEAARKAAAQRLSTIRKRLGAAGRRPRLALLADTRDELTSLGQAAAGLGAMQDATADDRAVVLEAQAVSNVLPVPATMPIPGQPTRTVAVATSAGQYEPFCLAVWAAEPLEAATWRVGRLTGSGGELPADALTVRAVKAWYHVADPTEYATPRLVSELLLRDPQLVRVDHAARRNQVPEVGALRDADELQPTSIAAGENQLYWFVVHVPDGAPAGEYTADLALRSAGAADVPIALQVRVYRFRLEDQPAGMMFGQFYRGAMDAGEPSGGADHKTPAQYEADMRSLVSHGMRHPTFYVGGTDLPLLVREMEVRNRAGLPKDVALLVGYPGTGNREQVRKALALAKQGGYERVSTWGSDEAKADVARAELAAIAVDHEEGALAHRTYWLPEAVGDQKIDLVMIGWDTPAKRLAAIRASGSKVVAYGTPFGWSVWPHTHRLHHGLGLWRKGFQGAANYAYQHGDALWGQVTAAEPSMVMCYPTADGVVETVQWAGARAGIDDLRYLTALQQAIARAKSRGRSDLATQADNWINQTLAPALDEALEPTVRIDPNYHCQWLKPQYLDLDALRAQMADWIEQLD